MNIKITQGNGSYIARLTNNGILMHKTLSYTNKNSARIAMMITIKRIVIQECDCEVRCTPTLIDSYNTKHYIDHNTPNTKIICDWATIK